MQHEVTFAGFGGQGILLSGKMLATAAMNEGKEVVWIPSYGPEMRGGTAYCTVVLSTRLIGSPIIINPENAVVLNRPSLDKFGPRVRPGGVLVINSSLIDVTSDRTDIDQVLVPCNDIAMAMGSPRATNMVALGAVAARTKYVDLDALEELIRHNFPKREVAQINAGAYRKGVEAALKA